MNIQYMPACSTLIILQVPIPWAIVNHPDNQETLYKQVPSVKHETFMPGHEVADM